MAPLPGPQAIRPRRPRLAAVRAEAERFPGRTAATARAAAGSRHVDATDVDVRPYFTGRHRDQLAGAVSPASGGPRAAAPSRWSAVLAGSQLVYSAVHTPTDRLVGFARVLTDLTDRGRSCSTSWWPRTAAGTGSAHGSWTRSWPTPRSGRVQSIELVCQSRLFDFYARWGFTEQVGGSRLMRRTSTRRCSVRSAVTVRPRRRAAPPRPPRRGRRPGAPRCGSWSCQPGPPTRTAGAGRTVSSASELVAVARGRALRPHEDRGRAAAPYGCRQGVPRHPRAERSAPRPGVRREPPQGRAAAARAARSRRSRAGPAGRSAVAGRGPTTVAQRAADRARRAGARPRPLAGGLPAGTHGDQHRDQQLVPRGA